MAKLREPQTMPGADSASKGKRMSEVAVAQKDLPDFIKPEDLMLVPKFTITNARKRRTALGDQIFFDLAYKQDEEVLRRTISFGENDERTQLMNDVRRHRFITNCRLDRIQLKGTSYYWKIVDADSIRLDPIPGETFTEEDIPF